MARASAARHDRAHLYALYQPVANGVHYDAQGNYHPRPFGPADGSGFNARNRSYLRTSDFSVLLQYQPGVAYINTKQRRILVNKEAPIYRISHIAGLRGVWSDYTYNLTEVGVRKTRVAALVGSHGLRFCRRRAVESRPLPAPHHAPRQLGLRV